MSRGVKKSILQGIEELKKDLNFSKIDNKKIPVTSNFSLAVPSLQTLTRRNSASASRNKRALVEDQS